MREARIVVDAGATVGKASPRLFGGVFYPNRDHLSIMGPQLHEVGITHVRLPCRPDGILPAGITLEDYKADKHGCRNPGTWDWSSCYAVKDAHARGIAVELDLPFGGPGWLTHNGLWSGVPKDWEVYREMIAKIVTQLAPYADYVGFLNEPRGFIRLEDAPYRSHYMAALDIQHHATRAVKELGLPLKILGPSDDERTLLMAFALLNDPRLQPSDLDCLTYHDYEAGNIGRGRELRQLMAWRGFGGSELWMNEWNDWDYNHPEDFEDFFKGAKGIGYFGRKILEFIEEGWDGANYFSLAPSNVLYDDARPHQQYWDNGHSAYDWDTERNTGRLYPKFNAFRVFSRKMKMGEGPTDLLATDKRGLRWAQGIRTAAGEVGCLLVNPEAEEARVTVEIRGVAPPGAGRFHVASAASTGEEAAEVPPDPAGKNPESGHPVSYTVILPPHAAAGLLHRPG